MTIIDIQGLAICILLNIAVFGLIIRSNRSNDENREKRIAAHELKYTGQQIPATFDIIH